jgi:hypothetical protein
LLLQLPRAQLYHHLLRFFVILRALSVPLLVLLRHACRLIFVDLFLSPMGLILFLVIGLVLLFPIVLIVLPFVPPAS